MSEGAIDFLNRDYEVDQIIGIINLISKSGKGCTFSINGEWGIGKSFFLDLLEEKLSPEYTVIRYNCWKNDYYKEPLEAILMVVAENINRLINRNHENIGRQMPKNLLNFIKYVSSAFAENKTGIKIEDAKNTIFKDTITYDDSMSPISNILKAISECIDELTKEYKIIIMVDELDRCIPEYAIKVLERLHHIFENKNIIVVLAVDKDQLERTVKNIFGENIKVDNYLKKFISFQTELTKGIFDVSNDNFRLDYISKFSLDIFFAEFKDYLKIISKAINIRELNQIIDKASIIHSFSSYDNTCPDLCYAAFEITAILFLNHFKINTFMSIFSYAKNDQNNYNKAILYIKKNLENKLSAINISPRELEEGTSLPSNYFYSHILYFFETLNEYHGSISRISTLCPLRSKYSLEVIGEIYELAKIIK